MKEFRLPMGMAESSSLCYFLLRVGDVKGGIQASLAEVRDPFYVLFQSNAPVLPYLIAACKVVP